MYCAFCGNWAAAICGACRRRMCRGHRAWWPTGAVCAECRPQLVRRAGLAAAWAVAAGLLLAVGVAVAVRP
jgi:hypothetical protein